MCPLCGRQGRLPTLRNREGQTCALHRRLNLAPVSAILVRDREFSGALLPLAG